MAQVPDAVLRMNRVDCTSFTSPFCFMPAWGGKWNHCLIPCCRSQCRESIVCPVSTQHMSTNLQMKTLKTKQKIYTHTHTSTWTLLNLVFCLLHLCMRLSDPGVTDGCELACWCWESNLRPVEEQSVLLMLSHLFSPRWTFLPPESYVTLGRASLDVSDPVPEMERI